MAVGSATRLRRGGGGGDSLKDSKEGPKADRKYVIRYTVPADPSSTADAILRAAGLPSIGDAYAVGGGIDESMYCARRNPTQVSPWRWEVDVEYSPFTGAEVVKPDPRDRAPKMSFKFQTFREPIVGVIQDDQAEDPNNMFAAAIANSAGEPYNPPPERDVSRPVLTVVRNQTSFNPSFAIEFQDAINSGPWLGAAKHQVKVAGISTSGRTTEKIGNQTVFYYPVTYEFHYRREGWDLVLLDHGTYYNAGADKVKFVDRDGNATKGLLDGAGGALGAGLAPKYLAFVVYRERNFGAFGFPNQFF